MATPQKISEVVVMLQAAILINGPATPEAVDACSEVWLSVFRDISDSELSAAVDTYLQTGRFWPSPADIRSLVPRLKSGSLALEDSNPETGRDLWPRILNKLGAIGPRHDWLPVLAERIGGVDQDRLGRAISDIGGWNAIRTANSDWERSKLGNRFRASWDRQARATAAGLLPGGEQKLIDITGELELRRREAARG